MNYKEQIKHPLWQRKRLEIMNRDKFKCRSCKSELHTLNVHHIYYEKGLKIWEYDNESLITLCENCHKNIHEINKIISLIAISVIDKKIDLVELNNTIEKL